MDNIDNNNCAEGLYKELGISKPVYSFCNKILDELTKRFETIDKISECNQLKVLHAMQKIELLKCI